MRNPFGRRAALLLVVATVAGPLSAVPAPPARADVLLNSANLLRNGWYSDQAALSPSTVTGGNFGRLFSAGVDGQVYAQPIVSQGTLLVATENNNVYGLDPQTGAQIWQRTYGTPFNPSDIACGDISPHIGITGTPVVDPATNIAYFTNKEYVSGSSGPSQYLAHAIDVATGAEQPGWPVTVQGYADNASHIDAHLFHPTTQLQRPGLLLMNGVIYMGFGSICDAAPYTGWIVGISTATRAITTMFTTIRDDNSGAGIWQSGSGLMSDRSGEIVFSTGNGGFDAGGPTPGNQPPNDLSEAAVRVVVQPDGTLKPVDFFAPYDSQVLEANDLDFGSGGPVALPDAYFGTPAHPHLMVMQSKQGYVYLLDRDNLGGFQQGPGGGDNAVARVGPAGGVWSRPAVWPGDGGYVYEVTANGSGGQAAGSAGFMRAYKYGLDGTGTPTLSLAASTADTFGFGSGAPVVSSNGVASGSALLWVVWEADGTGTNAQLRAYDPVPVNGQFNMVWSAPIGTASKFSMPAIDNAHVYVGTRDGHVLAFWSPVSAPLSAPSPSFPNTTVGQSTTQSVVFTAGQATTVNSFTSTNPAFQIGSPTPAVPASLSPGATITVPITFAPTQPGLAATTLRANTTNGPVDIALNALGQAATAKLIASPTQLSLGGTTAGGNALNGNVMLTNAGAASLTVGATDLPLPGSPFSVSGVPPAGIPMAPGTSIFVNVAFTPTVGTTPGIYNDAFTVHSDGGDQTVTLTAIVAPPPNVVFTPLHFDLGNVPLGATADSIFTLHNSGGLGASFVRSKPPARNVGFVARTLLPEGTTLPPGGTFTESVRFTATKLGTFSDTWSLNPADNLGLRTVTFTAHVVESAPLAVPSLPAWHLNGSAKLSAARGPASIRLTPPNTANVAGSAFFAKPVPSRYLHISFDAWIGGGTGADGLALVLADPSNAKPTSLGVASGGLGFSGIPGTAIALDTEQNAANPSANFVGITNGPISPGADLLNWAAANSAIPPLETIGTTAPTGYLRTHVDIQIANGLANVNVGGVPAFVGVPINLPSKVLVGFTGASGTITDEHTVTNVRIIVIAPQTTITTKPPAKTHLARATFAFSSSVAGSTFHCALDNRAAQPCRSPETVTVAPGTHTYRVRAFNPFGVADPTPALVTWTYIAPARKLRHLE